MTNFSKQDKKWQRFNQKLEKLMQENDFFGLGTTYYEMAAFAKQEGPDYEHLRQLGYEMKLKVQVNNLRQLSSDGYVKSVEAIATSNSCSTCKSVNGTKISLEEALNKSVLPVRECTFEPYGCRCTYAPSL